MSLKQLLGLESFPLSEMEIVKRIHEAYQNHREEVEFTTGLRKVRVRLADVCPEGIIRKDY